MPSVAIRTVLTHKCLPLLTRRELIGMTNRNMIENPEQQPALGKLRIIMDKLGQYPAEQIRFGVLNLWPVAFYPCDDIQPQGMQGVCRHPDTRRHKRGQGPAQPD